MPDIHGPEFRAIVIRRYAQDTEAGVDPGPSLRRYQERLWEEMLEAKSLASKARRDADKR